MRSWERPGVDGDPRVHGWITEEARDVTVVTFVGAGVDRGRAAL